MTLREEVSVAVASTLSSNNHDFENLSKSPYQSPAMRNKRNQNEDEEEVEAIPSNKDEYGNLSESALQEMLVKAIDEEPDLNARRKKFKNLSMWFAKRYNDSFANEAKNDKFRPDLHKRRKSSKAGK